ncbi:hypothetical protein ONZ45_g7178 [Pleurotus djamor]|nr:hypothetical protein ONZ45_g7178 [Pleurotus djamor]
MSSPNDSPSVADHPFNSPKANLILRSSDNVEFRVFKAILELSSPVFETMLEIPPPDHETSTETTPVFPLDESSLILDYILRFCYPGDNPSIPDVQTLELLVPVVDKYCLDRAMRFLEARYISICAKTIQNQPLQALVVACRHGWCDLAKKVAEACLYYSIDELIGQASGVTEEGVTLTSAAFWRLLEYHLRIRRGVGKIDMCFAGLQSGVQSKDDHSCGWIAMGNGSRGPRWWAAYVGQLSQEMSAGAPLRVLREALADPMKGVSVDCRGCFKQSMRCAVADFHKTLQQRVSSLRENVGCYFISA